MVWKAWLTLVVVQNYKDGMEGMAYTVIVINYHFHYNSALWLVVRLDDTTMMCKFEIDDMNICLPIKFNNEIIIDD